MNYAPKVSLIVPTFNEAQYIEDCLSSIASQDYNNELIEVLIFDGLSTDKTWSIIEKFIQGKPQFRLFTNPARLQAVAWNIGIREAKGNLIGIVSAHAIISEDYVTNVVETILRTQADLVGGPTFADSDSGVSKSIGLALNSKFGVGNGAFHYTKKEIEVDTVFMGVCWRNLYERLGGFDEELIRDQDDEFSYRILENKGRIICNPKIKSKYINRSTFGRLWSQYYQYGFWKVRVLQKHPKQMRLRQFVPLVFVGAIIVSFLLALSFEWGWIFTTLLVGTYLLSSILFSLMISTKYGWKHFPRLLYIFAILHISYGFGFMVGLFKFWNRWWDKKGKVPEFQ